MGTIHELRPKSGDSEKITINLGYVDLGHIDLMVQDGFYSNRTDFIRAAIRSQLDRHADVVRQSVARKTLNLASGITAEGISRQRGTVARSCTSTCSGSQASPRMSAPS